ncbi:TIGR04282 family arsenosugar biosynthesis glycosyltransferase [Flavitalea antarctica]
MEQALIIFTKNPIHGQVKTRLAAAVGKDMALSIYRRMLLYTNTITSDLPVTKLLYYSDAIGTQDHWSDQIYTKKLQRGAGLGQRMENAFRDTFELNYRRVMIIGTDCPGLTPGIITMAFDNLGNSDVVIGPAKDGGYYLLGMNKMHGELFRGINWSSETVLQETSRICSRLNLSTYLLEELSDIDTEEDLIAHKSMNAWLHD